jgi:hypothetical protein
MRALDAVVLIFFSLFRLPSNAKTADVIVTAVRDQNMVEISQAYRTVIFVNFSEVSVVFALT